MERVVYGGKTRIFYSAGDEVYSVFDNIPRIIDMVDLENMKIICTDGTVLPLSKDVRATEKTMKNAKVTDKRATLKNALNIKVKYLVDGLEKLQQIEIGNWVDLRCAEDIEIKEGEFALIRLGVAMELPKGYEAYILPRSSTYKNYKLLQVNSQGVIDNSYCGDTDEFKLPVLALKDTRVNKNDRICQFRIQKIMPDVNFIEVDTLGNKSRDGFGSTGTK